MARCVWCGGEMTIVDSCVVDHLHDHGRCVSMVPWGSELRWPHSNRRCGDCGVAPGKWHHLGCDIQECPTCGGQLLSCDCRFDEDGDDIDDEYDQDCDDDLDDDLDDHLDDDNPWDDGLGDDMPIDIAVTRAGRGNYPAGEFVGVDASGAVMERTTIAGIDVVLHHADYPDSDITTIRGIRCTTALRTVIDIAADTDPARLPRIVDDCLERGLFTVAEAYERLAQPDMATHRGADFVRRVLPPPG